jgi:hypothetical protein
MRRAICLSILVAAPIGGGEAVASAACSGPELHGHGLDPSWTEELSRVQSSLRGRADVDHCAEIDVSATTSGAILRVTLSDGRTGVRSVDRRTDLLATVEALALLPPPAETADEPSGSSTSAATTATAAPPSSRSVSPRPDLPWRPPGEDAALAAGPTRSSLRFDLGAAVGSRWSGGLGGSAGLLGEFGAGPWVLGVGARWEGYEGPAQSQVLMVQTVGVGAELGYRITLGRIGVVALLEPSIDALSQAPRYGTPGPVSVRDARVARLGGELRAMVLSEQRLRFFVALDGGVDVVTDEANQPGLLASTPALPTWSAGLSVGAQFRAWP